MAQGWGPGFAFSSEQGSDGQMPPAMGSTSTGTEQL